ncbi:hypothetical protein MUK42_24377 [Musa troglodytarum]|uniref:Uncharacterized protein n=1 Tax=Musa troglodytarum TaxID=320322 RepID=A0A9E7GDV6_9LILI|nr:hypothetical protein MUK42_24377 [Musa troglodytarum]
MASWRRRLGNLRTFVGNATGGLRGGADLASWVVAGTLAYHLWVKPAEDLEKELEVIWPCHMGMNVKERLLLQLQILTAMLRKRKPIPDPQETGLIYGKKKETTKSEK